MTAAEFVCVVSIFCIVLPKFVIAMTIIAELPHALRARVAEHHG